MDKLYKHRSTVYDIVDILCDRCGKSCKNKYGNFNFTTLSADYSFGSEKDGERHKADICEKCYDLIISKMKIKVQIK